MPNIVYSKQEVDWQDDGGAHDPEIRTVSDEQLTFLQGFDGFKESDLAFLDKCPVPELPCNVDAVLALWWSDESDDE